MNDEILMNFGKHKGRRLGDVPAAYLLWLWDNGVWAEAENPLHVYIVNTFSALEADAPDYLVKHQPK